MVKHKNNAIKDGWGSRAFDAANVCLMLFIALATVLPVWHLLVVSISDGHAVQTGKVLLLPHQITWATYAKIFQDASILRAYKNTLYYTLLGTAINMAMSILCAYPLSKARPLGRKPLSVFVVIPMYVSGGMIPNYLLINNLGLINTVWALVLPGAISTYNMVIMRTFFKSLPDDLEESARIDGAGEWRILLKIVLPLSTPIIATMIMFYAVGHWNSFFSAIIYLNQKSLYPIQVLLRNIVIANETQEYIAETASSSMEIISTTIKYAVVMVVITPILCIYPFAQKYFVKGMLVGSLKG